MPSRRRVTLQRDPGTSWGPSGWIIPQWWGAARGDTPLTGPPARVTFLMRKVKAPPGRSILGRVG